VNNPHIIAALAAFAAAGLASQLLQPPLTYNGGRGWDGGAYYQMAAQIAGGEPLRAESPFVYRPGTAALVAAFFPGDLMRGFKVVNLVAAGLASVLLASWLAGYLTHWKTVAVLVTLFVTQWHGPVRMTFFAPVYTDPWLLVFLLVGLHLISAVHKGRRTNGQLWTLTAVTIAATVIREVGIILAGTVLFAGPDVTARHLFSPAALVERVRRRPLLLLPACAGLAAIATIRLAVTPTGDYAFARAALTILYTKPLHTYVHAWFVTYGPVLALVIVAWRSTATLLEAEPFLAAYLLAVCALAWIGGVDTERFLFWGMPIVYLAIGRAIEARPGWLRSAPLLVVLVAAQLVSQRIFWATPDFPNDYITPFPVLTMPSSRAQYLDLFSLHGRRILEVISLLEYLVLTVILVKWCSAELRKVRSGHAAWRHSGVA
jgi:hypothetical protein